MKVDRSVSPSAERILAAADKLFYRRGIRAVGVDAVAAEAGVSKRTLYNYYPSKDDLIAAYVNAVTELGDPKHPAAGIAAQFKEQRRQWYRGLLERIGVSDPEGLATQLQLLVEGALAAALVRGDPKVARAARAAAEVLLDAAGARRPVRSVGPKRRAR